MPRRSTLSLRMLRAAVVCAAVLLLAPATDALAGQPPTAQIESVRVGSAVAPVRVEVRTSRNAALTLRVNGRRVADAFLPLAPKRRVADLGLSAGLKPGRNKIRVRATSPFGKASDNVSVTLSRGHLLANAGEDQLAEPDAGVEVGGEAPAGTRRTLRHRWRVIEAPRGAEPKLIGRSRPTPTLRAPQRGTYVLRLESRRRGGGRKVYDTVTVSVAEDPPIGARIETIVPNWNRIGIEGDLYPTNPEPLPDTNLNWVVLERTTRAAVESGSTPPTDQGMAALWDKADKYAGGSNFQRYLMIVSAPKGLPEAQLAAFATVGKRIGTGVLSRSAFDSLKAKRSFSVIGVPGGADGAATVKFPPKDEWGTGGSITGYLMQNEAVTASGAHLYDYVSPEHPSFDTRAAGSTATRNVLQIGASSYTRDLPGGVTAGFHIAAVEGTSMTTMHESIVPTNGSGISDRSRQAAAADSIKAALDLSGQPLFFLQTVGKPKAAGPEWKGVVKQLQRLGANSTYVNALDGSTEYALVGREGFQAPPREASTAYDVGPYPAPELAPARLIGSLTRARDSKFIATSAGSPTAANPDAGLNLDFVSVAYQGRTPWPALAAVGRDEQLAVGRFIWSELKFCVTAADCSADDVLQRNFYWRNFGANWTLAYSRLSNLAYPGDDRGFSSSTFSAAKAQLLKEIGAVADVQSYIARLRDPFDKSAIRQYVDLKQIGDDIWKSVQRPVDNDNSVWWGLMFASGVAKLGEFSPPPGSSAAAGISATFSFLAFLSQKTGGTPVLGEEIKARAAQLPSEMLDRIDQAKQQLTTFGKLFVSDYGKLMAVDSKVENAWRLPADDAATLAQLRNASRIWFHQALVPVAYPYLIQADSNNARNLDCALTGKRGWPNQPDDAQMAVTSGYDNNGSPIRQILFFSRGIGGAMSPPGGIGDAMFAPLDAQKPGLGIEKMSFLTPQIFNRGVTHAVNGQRLCAVGYLPGDW